MDEYLSEKEQIELIKQWWADYGWYLIGGALIALAGYFGYGQYTAYQQRTAAEAAALYRELRSMLDDDDRDAADALLAELDADYATSPYTDQARLLIARDYLIRDTERSISELTAVAEGSEDPELANIARIRLARALAYDEQYDRALGVLEVDDAGLFAALLNDVRGDIYSARGDTESAIRAYTDALTSPGVENLDRNYLSLKLTDLQQRVDSGAAGSEDSDDEGSEDGE